MSDRICEVCKQPVVHYKDGGYDFCSEFCGCMPEARKAAFQAMKPGDFGVYPCADCGWAVEGEWTPGVACLECDRKRRDKAKDALLREALPFCNKDLATRIRAALGE